MKTALYTGSFDPLTKGHLDIIARASQMFPKLVIGVGSNPKKTYLFDRKERMDMIIHNVKDMLNVSVIEIPYDRLTADIAYELHATIVKGVRMNADDFDYEWLMADINSAHVNGLQTVIMPASPKYNSISSSAAKEVCKLNGNTHDFVPLNVKVQMEQVLLKQRRVIVTGIIGAGKSTVVENLLIENPDEYHNIDLDVIARDILFTREEPVYIELRQDIQRLLSMPVWDRKALGSLVFNDASARDTLNKAMEQPLATRLRATLSGRVGTIMFNSALIIEAGWLHLANNNVILLDVNRKEQLRRLKTRGYSINQTMRRINAQLATVVKEERIQEAIKRDNFGKVTRFDTSGISENHTLIFMKSTLEQL